MCNRFSHIGTYRHTYKCSVNQHSGSWRVMYGWLYTWTFVCCCCNSVMFYDWCECVVSVLGTTKHSSATVLTLGKKVILYCIVIVRTFYLSVYRCPSARFHSRGTEGRQWEIRDGVGLLFFYFSEYHVHLLLRPPVGR